MNQTKLVITLKLLTEANGADGKASHDVVFMGLGSNIRLKILAQKPRKILLYKKANWDAIKSDMFQFQR